MGDKIDAIGTKPKKRVEIDPSYFQHLNKVNNSQNHPNSIWNVSQPGATQG